MDALRNPMQNLFHMKRLSLRHRRYCFHKGLFFFFPFSFFTKPLKEEIQWFYLITQKENSELLYVHLECPLPALIIVWDTHPPVKDLQDGLRVGTPAYSLLWVSCHTPPSLLRADKKSFPLVAIVILSCWALHYLEGNQRRTRGGGRMELMSGSRRWSVLYI